MARTASYWSSKGQRNPVVPETLTYRLIADLYVVTEIKIRPFQAYFQFGYLIYSAKSVRFRMGHIKDADESCQDSDTDRFAWTHTSLEFEMAQENRLQTFKLPESCQDSGTDRSMSLLLLEELLYYDTNISLMQAFAIAIAIIILVVDL
ncbi:hypothetical protein Godav_017804 [Gossypium davidsonii]|uniref:Uncharacterized protein n=2 Tax=Gossypium TaxID=3633 RepID=A0A7J8QUG0_GOSDV|nr:hypothetical protein [Gossypium davidsonii]